MAQCHLNMTRSVKFGRLTEPMNDPRALFSRAVAQAGSVLAAIKPVQASLPTPCTDWDVRALASHLVGVLTRVALVGEGADALSVPAFTDLGDDRWDAQYQAARQRAEAAWADDAKLDAVFTVPWGKAPGRVVLAGYTREVLTHGWDLATATGQETELDAGLGEFALAVAQQSLPADQRENIPFGPVVPVADDAGVYARLAAWMGRKP